MQVLEKDSATDNERQLANLYQYMLKNGDKLNAEKVLDLYEKKLHDSFYVHFTGHFSAGKSSLINFIVGEDLLPKSPIPTSANIVKITSGLGVARVFFNEETPIEYKEPYDIDMIKDYCMDKDTISKIEIHTSKQMMPKNTFIVDTPGIDAADDADRYMTESSLHEVDVLYFVMDYNHVQSELNLTFLKDIQEQHIPIRIIVNQIDKHDENELSFNEFTSRVEETFRLWNIVPDKMYFTTMKRGNDDHNQVDELKKDLFTLLHHKQNINDRLRVALDQIIQSHEQFIRDKYEADDTVEISPVDHERYKQLNNKIQLLKQKDVQFTNEFSEELEQTLKNAYVMPASLRELAGEFLESQQKGFKVGFLQAKKKTEAEKERRLEHFLQQLNESIQSTIEWKLREKFITLVQKYGITDERFIDMIQQFTVSYEEADALAFVKDGAMLNGNYILNYTNEVNSDIKAKFRQQAIDLLAIFQEEVKKQVNESLEALQTEKEPLETKIAQWKHNEVSQEKITNALHELHTIANGENVETSSVGETEKALEKRLTFAEGEVILGKSDAKDEGTKQQEKYEEREDENEDVLSTVTDKKIVEKIDKLTKQIEELPNFSSIVHDLIDKKERIENRDLTIALFGAFSAGKSSFSNALLGNTVLPVSPNPTTAVISRIKPVTETYEHGTVVITYKSADELAIDVQTITKSIVSKEDSFHELIEWIKRENISKHALLSNMYQAYLDALLNGYEQRKQLLGKSEQIAMDQFEAYVTDESIAAYIACVDLYYDCALTKKGITLVDTPGADSVNARHTNVAFDYIKAADAIIYVTYYNHAITSADRDFLLQLGRVKESFELDKMFFIVNAADLAEDDTELKLVLDYVQDQLLQFGIRNTRIYPISSKNSLEEKRLGHPLNDQMVLFEKEFFHFIEHDLHALTYQAAMKDMERAKTQLQSVIRTATLDSEAKENYVKQLNENELQVKETVVNKDVANVIRQIKERIERQLHYVNERFYIRFHDMFTEFFNPTTITENGRRAQLELEKNRNQLIDYVGYELLQEIRAVSLRVESYAQQLIQQFYHELEKEIVSVDEVFTLSSFTKRKFETPAYEQALQTIDVSQFTSALKIYKNKRQFFEQNDREKMKDAFYDILNPEMMQYIELQRVVMEQSYKEQMEFHFTRIKEEIELEISNIKTQQLEAVEQTLDIDKLHEKLSNIETVLL